MCVGGENKCINPCPLVIFVLLRDVSREKNGKMWEFFPSWGPPLPPVWECHVFERKKLWFIFHFRTLGTFIVWGSPMLKTVKNGSGIWVEPLPCFFEIPTFSRFFFGQRP